MAENTQDTKVMQGKNKFLLFRRLADKEKENAIKLVYQTSHTFSFTSDNTTIVTKDGNVIIPAEVATEVPIEAIQSVGDPTADMLMEAVLNQEMLEMWEVTYDESLKNEDGKYPAIYTRGYLNSWELPNPAEGESTISTTFNVEKKPQWGYATITAEVETAVQYAFHDTLAGSEEEITPEIARQRLGNAITSVRYVPTSTDGSDVVTTQKWTTVEEKQALQDAVTTAEAVRDKADATVEELTQATAELTIAITTYEAAQKDGTKDTP